MTYFSGLLRLSSSLSAAHQNWYTMFFATLPLESHNLHTRFEHIKIFRGASASREFDSSSNYAYPSKIFNLALVGPFCRQCMLAISTYHPYFSSTINFCIWTVTDRVFVRYVIFRMEINIHNICQPAIHQKCWQTNSGSGEVEAHYFSMAAQILAHACIYRIAWSTTFIEHSVEARERERLFALLHSQYTRTLQLYTSY